MKQILVLLLLTGFIGFGQTPGSENFSIKNGAIFWERTFDSDSLQAVNYFKSNLKISNPDKGIVVNQKTRCRGVAIYAMANFQYSYKIKYSAKSYTVTISEIIYDEEIQIRLGGVSSSKSKNRIEEFEIRSKDGTLRKNQQSIKNLNCLDEYFIKTFSINPDN